MAPEELHKTLKAQPFEPFRIVLTDSEGYDIRHPDLVLVGKRTAIVGLMGRGHAPFFDHTVKVDLLHISRIEPLTTPSKRKSNGKH